MFYLDLATDICYGELVTFFWDNLDLEAQTTLTIFKSARRTNGKVKATQLKTVNSVWTIFLPQKIIGLPIQEHTKQPGNLIMFPSLVTNKLYSPYCAGRAHKDLLKKLGIESPPSTACIMSSQP